MKKKGTLIAGALLILVVLLAAVVAAKFKPQTIAGEKEITVIVVHGDGSEKEFVYQTDAEYLGDVIVDNELVSGEKGQYGLYITAADGETAQDSKQQWWCITKAGAELTTSADTTPIQDGEQYELTLKEGY